MFSLGMLIVAVFSNGQSLIQANNNLGAYFKQAGVVREKPYIVARKQYNACNFMYKIFISIIVSGYYAMQC